MVEFNVYNMQNVQKIFATDKHKNTRILSEGYEKKKTIKKIFKKK